MGRSKSKWLAMSLSMVVASSTIMSACAGKTENGGAAGGQAENKDIHILLSHSNAKYAMQLKDNDDYVKELSKQSGYNLKFEFLGHGNDYIQQLTVRFASGDLPDLIRTDSIDSTMHPGALQQGVFHELGPLIDQYGPNIKKKIPQEAWESTRVSSDGKIYGIPALSALPASRVMYIRQDWLDQLGMKQPETLDEFLEFFEAVKNNDLNGNGDPNDEYGFYVRENLQFSDVFFREFGASPNQWYYRDDQLVPGMILPEMKEALKFWKDLYDKGYINPNLFTNKSADWEAGIKQGKAGLWMHDIINYMSNWQLGNFVNQPNVKLSVINPPQGPSGGGITAQSDQIYFVWVIPSKVKNPEEIIKFLDWTWSDEAETFFSLGIKDVNYTEENGGFKWDPKAPANSDNDASIFYQLSINPRGDGRMLPTVIDAHPDAEFLKKGVEIAKNGNVPNDGLHMPVLESLKTHPELAVGTNSGTLFLDMFAKVITGKEDLDASFDNFVSEWKRRGGDAAIQEATDWYKSFHNK
ncbi:extracellular solute-binding protein [Paenibacillus sp. J2TS4]|uniref:extracellular solute-binding protein n=1 Tax=Paenibacillus sp. J2TS4 TaxID=2807194 RepID=UPI001B081A7A|nr:extracellular solute-binding protein [Paenibacillus sp. J2TS4]GIP32748.1 lipoprotein LipO [Paenibacillus sp. J2TS4]